MSRGRLYRQSASSLTNPNINWQCGATHAYLIIGPQFIPPFRSSHDWRRKS